MLRGDELFKFVCFAALFMGKFFQLYLTGRAMDAIIVTVAFTKTVSLVYVIVSAYFLVLPVILGFVFLYTVYKNFEKKFLLTVELGVASVIYIACVALLYILSLDEGPVEDIFSFDSHKTKAVITIISILVTQTAHVFIVNSLVCILERIQKIKRNEYQNLDELEATDLSDTDNQEQYEVPLDVSNGIDKQMNKETLTELEDVNDTHRNENVTSEVADKPSEREVVKDDVNESNVQDLVTETNVQNSKHDSDITNSNEQNSSLRDDVNDRNEHNTKQHEYISDEKLHDAEKSENVIIKGTNVTTAALSDGSQPKGVINIVVHDPNSRIEEIEKVSSGLNEPKETHEVTP